MNIAVDPHTEQGPNPLSFGALITIWQYFPRDHRPGHRVMARVRRRDRKHSDWPSCAETYMDIVDGRIMAETLAPIGSGLGKHRERAPARQQLVDL